MNKVLIAAIAGTSLATSALGVIIPEIEDNNSKATATLASGLVAGDVLSGISTGSSTTTAGIGSADYWRVSTAPAAPGIYRHRLSLTTNGTAGHTGTLRGLNQVGATAGTWDGSTVGTAGATDTSLQTSSSASTPARFNQWYGFGRAESIYYRVAGTTATTADYNANYSMDPVTPIAGPTGLAPGSITITAVDQGHTTDTDMWVYDSGFNAILGAGNDDNSLNGGGTGNGLGSLLTRTYTPGIYYLAISNFNVANNMGSPNDDDFRTGALLDFQDALLNTSTSTNLNVTVSIGGTQVTAIKVGAYDVAFVQFEVVPAPGSVALLGLGGLLVGRRRR